MSRPAFLLGILVVLAALPLSVAGTPGPPAPVASVIEDPTTQPIDDPSTQTFDGLTAPTNGGPTAQTNTTTERPGIDGLAFFTTYHRDTAPPVRIGYSAQPGADGFFVLTNSSGAVLGHTEYESYGSAIHADGQPVPFDEPVHGIVDLTVTAYDDTNGNREFDPAVDEPYREPDGQPVASTMTFLVPNESGPIQPQGVDLVPPSPGTTALHHFEVRAQRDLTVRAVAVNYRYSGIRVEGIDTESAGVGLALPEKSNRRTGAKTVEEPLSNVVVIEPDDPFIADAGSDVLVNLDGMQNPTEARNVTVIVNPYGEAYATTMTIEPGREVPSIDLVQVRPQHRSTVVVNLYFPAGRTGVVKISTDGDVIGRSQVVGGQPDMHVDFLEVPVEAELAPGDEVTVTLLTDSDADNTYEEPFLVDGEPVSREVTVLQGLETDGTTASSTTPPTDPTSESTTATSVPGFGIGLAIVALLVGLLVRRP